MYNMHAHAPQRIDVQVTTLHFRKVNMVSIRIMEVVGSVMHKIFVFHLNLKMWIENYF
jgi:hypothetical protein